MKIETQTTDVLIIGAGGAGLRAAIEAAALSSTIIMVSKEPFGRAHTEKAMGGLNVAIKKPATPKQHFLDTVNGGWKVNNARLVELFTSEMPDRIYDLEEYGVKFDRLPDGTFYAWASGKQSAPLNLCCGDYTGREMMKALSAEAKKRGIAFLGDHFVTKIVTKGNQIVGATILDSKKEKLIFIHTKAIIVAAGGAGQLYAVTSNEPSNTGEGYAWAYDIGAELIDMEFIQFHPTGMADSRVKGSLVTEKVRGHKGYLKNTKGERFMKKYQPKRLELAGRDEVARAIYTEIQEGRGTANGGVYLDVTHLKKSEILKLIPDVYENFKAIGVDISKTMMEITPTMHHVMGGIKINEWGETNIDGFFAAGEVTGGIHGANRLGGNSLAEGQVFGRRAGIAAAKYVSSVKHTGNGDGFAKKERERITTIVKRKKCISPDNIQKRLKQTMWEQVSIIRNKESLTKALDEIKVLQSDIKQITAEGGIQKALETIEMITVAYTIVTAALLRTESRGSHFRNDYPKKTEKWLKNIILRKQGSTAKTNIVPVKSMV